MFERFDDPGGFAPDDRFRAAVDRRGRQLRRRRRLTRAGLGVVIVAVLAAGLYVVRRDAAIDRVDVATQPSTDGAVNILLLGDDGHGRADTIAIVRLDDAGNRLLSIPRDLIDADGGRIGAALADGPQGMVDAVWAALAIPIDHVVALDFDGFAALVDAVGGLPVSVSTPVRDESAGLALEPASCTTLDGATALAYVRARHLEQLDPATGTWVPDPTGDLGRMVRQQGLLGAAWRGFKGDIASFDELSRVLADHAVLDSGLTLGRLVDYARRLASPDSMSFDNLVVEAATTTDGAAGLRLEPVSAFVQAAYGADGQPSVGTLPAAGPGPGGLNRTPGPVMPIGPCPGR